MTEFQRALLDHFDAHRRSLPWRKTADPYRIWVSEVMLQQTRAETVCAYYERWMQQFPEIHALANATIDAVLKAWEGLGYYSRAHNLHRGAQVVCERHRGILPSEPDHLRTLPGIGEYTAGAIASIAYGVPAPAVDGNVKRVLCRLLDKPRLTSTEFRNHAARLVPQRRPGDFNQALIELGATLCTARSPRCDRCPVSTHCQAFARGTQLKRPARESSAPIPDRRFVTLVIIDDARNTIVHQRPPKGLLAGMWEFPTFEGVRPQRFLRQLLGKDTPTTQNLGLEIHPFSHFRAHYAVHLC
ncbi:MAG: A/G-specific adenine glycosylase, partial [Longimicrobiales bacterium]